MHYPFSILHFPFAHRAYAPPWGIENDKWNGLVPSIKALRCRFALVKREKSVKKA
jgi:hypothetical protein